MQCDLRRGDSLVLIGASTIISAEAPSPGRNPVRYPCSLQTELVQSPTWERDSQDIHAPSI